LNVLAAGEQLPGHQNNFLAFWLFYWQFSRSNRSNQIEYFGVESLLNKIKEFYIDFVENYDKKLLYSV